MEKDLENFLHRAPPGSKLSVNLRQKVLLKLIKAMRQADASTTLGQASEVEFDILTKSGGTRVVSSVYLSGVNEFIKRIEQSENGSENGNGDGDGDDDLINYETLREIVASEDILKEYIYPEMTENAIPDTLVNRTTTQRTCRRCGTCFTPSKYYSTHPIPPPDHSCRYHPGKTEKIGGMRVYGCCHAGIGDDKGCETGDWHVFSGYRRGEAIPRFHGLQNEKCELKNAVALDAEMSYTSGGYEVSRLTILDFFTENTILDILILPRCPPILDYNTKWSGINSEMYETGQWPVVNFEEAKEMIGRIVGPETILIGHSLDNDLRVLEVITT